MNDSLEIEFDAGSGGVPVLRLRGRLESGGAQALRAHCAALQEQGYRDIVLDLAAVFYVASSGLGMLLLLTDEFRAAGGRLVLAAPQESVIQVLKLLNLEQLLEIEPTVAGVLARPEA